MTIVFEPYSGPTTQDGTVAAKLPLRSLMTNLGDGIFMSRFDLGVDLEGDAQSGDATFNINGGFDVRFWPFEDGVFVSSVDLNVDFSSSALAPDVSVFLGTINNIVSFAGFETNDGEFSVKPSYSVRFAPTTSLFASSLSLKVYMTDGLSPMLKTGFLLQQPMIFGKAHEGFTITLTDGIAIGSEAEILRQVWVLLDQIGIADAAPTIKELIKILSDQIGLFTLIRYSQRLILQDGIKTGATTFQGAVKLIALMETIRITAGPDWSAEIAKVMAVLLALGDKADAATFASLAETINIGNVQSVDITYFEKLVQVVSIAMAATNSLIITAVLKDGFIIGDVPTTLAEILKVLTSSIGITAVLSTGEDVFTAWVMDAETKAAWRYDNYPFNSFAQLGDTFLGALPDGIYRLEGDDDAGTPIGWHVRSGLLNFGTQLEKRVDVAYIGYTSAGDVGLSVYTTNPEGEKIQYNFVMVGRTADVTRENRIKVGRGLESVYWAFELVGTGDFTLSDWQILPIVGSRRVTS